MAQPAQERADELEYIRTLDEGPNQGAAEPRQPLVVQVVGGQGTLALDGRSATLGSGQRNDLVLPDPYVSRVHASLKWEQGRLWIEDAGSRNGTWVNNLRVERCGLSQGARIKLGHTCLALDTRHNSGTQCLVGEHRSIKLLVERIGRLGATSHPALVMGETGTGKELTARALHAASDRAQGPFEPLNCGAIPRDLAEAELFGHVRGAFTGASRARAGIFERASGGTLFLDEIGEMPLDLQPKLLRVLEEAEVQRVGDSRRLPVDVRVVAATNCDLLQAAQRGRFRLDLYHRLAVGVLELPPLRARVRDIPLLVQHFLNRDPDGAQITVTREALEQLREHLWPGNVRELRNALCRAAMEQGPTLGPEAFSFLRRTRDAAKDSKEGYVLALGRTMEQIRCDSYRVALRSHQGNRTAAAAALGVPKSTFFDQVKAMGL